MYKKLSFVFIITVLTLSFLSALTLAEGEAIESLHLTIFADPTEIAEAGQAITLTYQIYTNEPGKSAIFYAPIPENTEYRSVEGAEPQNYTIGVLSDLGGLQVTSTDTISNADVRSVIWAGEFTGPRYITLTVESLNGKGTAAEAALIDNDTHTTAMTATKNIDTPRTYIFLPVIFNGYTPPTPTPVTPTPVPTAQPTATPDPGGSAVDVAATISMISSNNVDGVMEGDYDDVLGGLNVWAGRNEVSTAIYPTQSNILESIGIGRGGYTFDTRAYSSISSATLTFRVDMASTFDPEDYRLVLEKSNWSYLDVSEGNDGISITQAQWNGVVSGPIAVVDASGAPKSLYSGTPVTKTVTLPAELFAPGDYSSIRVRLNKEGTAPPDTFFTGGGNEGVSFYVVELNVVP